MPYLFLLRSCTVDYYLSWRDVTTYFTNPYRILYISISSLIVFNLPHMRASGISCADLFSVVLTPSIINLYLVKMNYGSLLNHLATFFRIFFSVIDTFLNLLDWIICWHIFHKYHICFENNGSKCTQCSFVDDNKNSCNFFTDITSTCKWPFSRQRVGDSILLIMYDTQACTSVIVISRMNKSLSMRLYYNHLSLSLYDMLVESVLSLNLWWIPRCDKLPGIVILLMMCDWFFVIFQPTIGIDVLVFLSGYSFLSLLLYNICRCDFKPLLLLGFACTSYSGLLTLLNFLFPRRDFLLLSFFLWYWFVWAYTPWFLVGCRITSFKITSFSR